MALKDRIDAGAPRLSKFEQWLTKLASEHRETIESWGRDSRVSTAKIVAAIAVDDPQDGFAGYRANKDTVSAWRQAL
ncbi:hypothetical protein SK224_08205 [Microbacterium sp. BG28]|uniref:hypothetical protein n=1 Tax=Microbacterium sp. BG28 TaxID=3097356 RepID=UPI002A5A3823|nr:hypothetical protein [Microbacterium sp. BG28]MDY0829110.1 hypothetical protein [Microbacterium sp. BG28]